MPGDKITYRFVKDHYEPGQTWMKGSTLVDPFYKGWAMTLLDQGVLEIVRATKRAKRGQTAAMKRGETR